MAKLSEIDMLSIGNTIQLVGAVWAGSGKMYLCLFPGEEGKFFDDNTGETDDFTWFESGGDPESRTTFETLEMNLEEWQEFIRQTDLLETEVIAKAEDGKLCKAVIRKSQRQISQQVSWAVFRRDNYTCRYCGRNDVPLTVDHLVLWEEGGPSTEANLVSACKKCNKTRGNTQYAEWLQDGYYKRVSANLRWDVLKANLGLVGKLDAIPRSPHKKSHR